MTRPREEPAPEEFAGMCDECFALDDAPCEAWCPKAEAKPAVSDAVREVLRRDPDHALGLDDELATVVSLQDVDEAPESAGPMTAPKRPPPPGREGPGKYRRFGHSAAAKPAHTRPRHTGRGFTAGVKQAHIPPHPPGVPHGFELLPRPLKPPGRT